jgi:AcrR family transcriptional regulator
MATAGRSCQDADAPRPMRADARRNFERLVVAAREAFTEHGPDASLDEIARRAGVGPGTLYRHFPTRVALLAAVYRDDVARLSARAHELLAEKPIEEALVAWMREQVAYVLHRRALSSMIKTMLDRDSEMLTWCKTTMREAVGALVVRAQEAGLIRPEVSGSDVLRLGHAIGYMSESAPEDADRLLSYMLDGLRPPSR